MVGFIPDDTALTLANPENPSTDFLKLSTTEQSLIEKGVVVGQRFQVNANGEVEYVLFRELTEAEAAAVPVGGIYYSGGRLKGKDTNGVDNIT